MGITGKEFELEQRRLNEVKKLLDDKIAKMSAELFDDDVKFQEFRRYIWENKRTMDSGEMSQVQSESELEANNTLIDLFFPIFYDLKIYFSFDDLR